MSRLSLISSSGEKKVQNSEAQKSSNADKQRLILRADFRSAKQEHKILPTDCEKHATTLPGSAPGMRSRLLLLCS